MAKFEGLTSHLAKQNLAELIMTFDEIQAAAGVELPKKSSPLPQYWENSKTKPRGPNKAAREAGYETFLIKGQDKVRFVRAI